MNYALYQYMNRDGLVHHALVDIKTKDVYKADQSIVDFRLIWKKAMLPEYVWLAIQNDKHHKVVATAAHINYILPRH